MESFSEQMRYDIDRIGHQVSSNEKELAKLTEQVNSNEQELAKLTESIVVLADEVSDVKEVVGNIMAWLNGSATTKNERR